MEVNNYNGKLSTPVLTWLPFLGGNPFTKLVRQDPWNSLRLSEATPLYQITENCLIGSRAINVSCLILNLVVNPKTLECRNVVMFIVTAV